MSSDSTDNLKVALKDVAKEHLNKLDKYGSFIIISWIIGTIFLYFIQKSLEGDPLRNTVVIVCLIYTFLFPFFGAVIYVGVNALVDKIDK